MQHPSGGESDAHENEQPVLKESIPENMHQESAELKARREYIAEKVRYNFCSTYADACHHASVQDAPVHHECCVFVGDTG